MSDWNVRIIDEFRNSEGKVGGMFAGKPLLLLHSIGARSGRERVNPLMYQEIDGGYAVFASKAGAHTHPDWYYNLLANPVATVEVGTEVVDVIARVANGGERDEIWVRQKADHPHFAEYEAKTDRQIPVIVLERQG